MWCLRGMLRAMLTCFIEYLLGYDKVKTKQWEKTDAAKHKMRYRLVRYVIEPKDLL